MVASAVEARRAPGPVLSGCPNHLNRSTVVCTQAVVADKVIADFFAEMYELKGEELAVEDAARAVHVQKWLGLDPAKKLQLGKGLQTAVWQRFTVLFLPLREKC